MAMFISHEEMEAKKGVKKKRSWIFRALYHWGKILGINPLNLSDSDKLKFSYFGLIYACFLTLIHSYILYGIFIERLNLSLPGDTLIAVIVNFIVIFCDFIETALTWLIYGFFQNRIVTIVKSFENAERMSRELEISENNEKHLRKIAINLGIISIIHITWTLYRGYLFSYVAPISVILLLFNIPRIASYSSMTIFVWSLMIVRGKFRHLNDTVRHLMKNYYAHIRQHDHEVQPGLIRTSRLNPLFLSDRITAISQLHRELRDLIYHIKEHFDLLVLMHTTRQLTIMTFDVHYACLNLKTHSLFSDGNLLIVSTIGCEVIPIVIGLAMISEVCGSTSDEANETGNVVHAMLNDCETYGVTPEAAKFYLLSLDLLENKVKISVFDCFDLNHFFVLKILIMVITYLAIMFQFDDE